MRTLLRQREAGRSADCAQRRARRNDAALRRGLRDTGPLPREFRLSSKWADL